MENEVNKYAPKIEEWFFEDEADEAMGIESIQYENGSRCKRAKLSDGRLAEVRRLKGKDHLMIQRIANNESGKFQSAAAAMSAKIDGKGVVVEDLENMWYNDFTKIISMSSSINFM